MSELAPRPPGSIPEHLTGARFSFANSSLARRINLRDYSIGVPGRSYRLINYRDTDPTIRERLEEQKLILGTRVSGNAYKVPRSARPLAYEATESKGGAYSYNDENLLYDLGVLLGSVAYSDPDPSQLAVVVTETPHELAQMVAIVDFTHPDEKNLFLVPGAENSVAAVSRADYENPAFLYDQALREVFGESFASLGYHFHTGFNEQSGDYSGANS